MLDPEDVTSPELQRLDYLITANRALHEFLGDHRRREFTKAYDRLRKARIANGANIHHRHPQDAA